MRRRLCAIFIGLFLFAGAATAAESLNELILSQLKHMPKGGRYSTSNYAKIKLESSAHFESGKLFILPAAASPSFCSGATYLVFIKTIEALRERGDLALDFATLDQLMVRDQHDGEGIWGRWNANGPGTARLFYELGLGSNFTSLDQAQPGDFMKIFWTGQVGKSESGHSVIYLGHKNMKGIEYVRYWSSNIPVGYSEKEVPITKIANMIFSRLETPANLARAATLPPSDPYLASLLTKRSSFAEASKKCGM